MESSHGYFSGEPETRWLTEDVPDRRMALLADFCFTDPKGMEWRAPKGYEGLDGASIPRALWNLVGSPYTGDYRRASIVHDWAVDEAQGDDEKRRAADRMFYHACRAGGCDRAEATLLYLGVRLGAWLSVDAKSADAAKFEQGARVETTSAERLTRARYRVMAEQLLEQTLTDDPVELERRTDMVFRAVMGKSKPELRP
jgi:hypothetical protein